MSAPDLVLIGCGKTKVRATAPVRACDLYTGNLFLARRRYAERSGVEWAIVSARYGIVRPSDLVSEYDETISKLSPAQKAEWHDLTRKGLRVVLGAAKPYPIPLRRGSTKPVVVEVHAGAAYVAELGRALESFAVEFTAPMAGLGIGEQLATYKLKAGGAA